MGKRDGGYPPLHGDTEIDEGFFSTETPEEQKDCPLKRGRVTTDGFSSYVSLEKDGMASTSCCCSVMHLSTPTKRSSSKEVPQKKFLKTIRYELISTSAYLGKTKDKYILYLARSLKTRQSFLSIWEKLKDFSLPYNTGKS